LACLAGLRNFAKCGEFRSLSNVQITVYLDVGLKQLPESRQ